MRLLLYAGIAVLVNYSDSIALPVGPKLLVIIISYYFIKGAPALESETHVQNAPDYNPINSGGGETDGRWSRWRLNQDAEINVALLKPPQVPGAGTSEQLQLWGLLNFELFAIEGGGK